MEPQGTGIFFLLVAMATTYHDVSDAGNVDTWDYCLCSWDLWMPWEDCTSTCFGQQFRSRDVKMLIRDGCSEFNDCATDDEGYEIQGCNEVCHHDDTNNGSACSCSSDAEQCSSAPCQNGGECIGNQHIYTCICQAGWNGTNCENDIQPPVVEGCSGDIDVNATETTVNVSWTAPTFSDPMLTELPVTINGPNNYSTAEFTFPWGDFTVQYVATRPSNGLQTECTFQIRVRPTPCEELNTPINGAVVCNDWKTDYGRFCMVSCREGFTIDPALSYETWFVCGASGTWISSNPLPDCTVPIDGPMDIPYQPEYSDFSIASCSDVTPVKSLYIQKLQEDDHFSEFCSYYPDECNVNNVYMKCS